MTDSETSNIVPMPPKIVSDALASAAVAAGLDDELAQLALELGVFRQHCSCKAGVAAAACRRVWSAGDVE